MRKRIRSKIKMCSKCKKKKDVLWFSKNRSSTDGLQTMCKDCVGEYARSYYKKNKKKIDLRIRKYYQAHKNEKAIYHIKYRGKNREKIAEYGKNYRKKHKKEIATRMKIYGKKNKKRIDRYSSGWHQKHLVERHEKGRKYYQKNKVAINRKRWDRIKKNPHLKMRQYLSKRLWDALRNQGVKKTRHTMDLVGCTIVFLKKYIESKFLPGMTWENYGYYGWHVDHKIPCVYFDLADPEEQKKCFNYKNLQPLWWYDNFVKNSSHNGKCIRRPS